MGRHGIDRHGQAYFGVDGIDILCQSLIISDALFAALNGSDARPLECFVAVTVGGVAVPYIESIEVSRGLKDKIGKCRIGVLCRPDAVPAGIATNAEVIITAGIRLGADSASQQIFLGNLDTWTAPDPGDIHGVIEAFDGAKRLDLATVSGYATGDVKNWVSDQCEALSLGTDFAVIQRGANVNIPTHSLAGYRSLLDAAVAMLSAYNLQYLFFSGTNELVLLDPEGIAAEDAIFDLSKLTSFHPIEETGERFNRVIYSNYVGYANNFVNYTLTVTASGTNTITASNVSDIPIISGTYDDAADQAIYGVLSLPGGVQNNICATEAELIAFATSVANESHRTRKSAETRFNPWLELGAVVTYGGDAFFVADLRHMMTTDGVWKTAVELWGI